MRWLPGKHDGVRRDADPHGRHYEPRTGAGLYYRYSPRRVAWFHQGIDDFWKRALLRRKPVALPRSGIPVHSTVFERIERGVQGYAPLFLLPTGAKLKLEFTDRGEPREPTARELALVAAVEEVGVRETRRLQAAVRVRQAAYFWMVAATVATLVVGFSARVGDYEALASAQESFFMGLTPAGIVSVIKGFVPDLASGLVDAAAMYPWRALGFGSALGFGFLMGARARWRLGTSARVAYERSMTEHRADAESNTA